MDPPLCGISTVMVSGSMPFSKPTEMSRQFPQIL
jgi:hypothetical protein